MDRIKEVLTFLREKDGYISGDYISTEIGISRTAVWKYMNQLAKMGYKVSKLKGKGYRLAETPDRLYPWEVERFLDTKVIGRKVVYKERLDSTNSAAFKLALGGEPEGTCVVTETQEKGKGRLGRVWVSPFGKNVYVSAILRPRIHPSVVYPITFISSLAVSDTIETMTGLQATLKWPNDVLLNGKKICGTLLELSTEADVVRFVIVGVGFNVNMVEEDLDAQIKRKATSLFLETKKVYERAAACGILLSNLEHYYELFREKGAEAISAMWEERAAIKGKHLEISQMGETHRGICMGIAKDGGILLNTEEGVKKIIAGDVNF